MNRRERRLARRRQRVRARRLRLGAATAVVATGFGLTASAARAQVPTGNRERVWAEAAFADLVGRRMSPRAAERWAAELDAGATRAELLDPVIRSQELRARFVSVLFQLYLERPPTAAEAGSWAAMTEAGAPHVALETSLLASPEYAPADTAFVDQLYADVLDRAAEPAGRDYWLLLLGGGASRNLVAGQFLRSEEAAVLRSHQTTLAFYDRYVDLTADGALVDAMRWSGDWPSQWATAVQSPEYEQAAAAEDDTADDGPAFVEAVWGLRPGQPS